MVRGPEVSTRTAPDGPRWLGGGPQDTHWDRRRRQRRPLRRAGVTGLRPQGPADRTRAADFEPNTVPEADWLLADACELTALEEAGIQTCDVLIAATGDDKSNLVVGLLAKSEFGVPRVVARINELETSGCSRRPGASTSPSRRRAPWSPAWRAPSTSAT